MSDFANPGSTGREPEVDGVSVPLSTLSTSYPDGSESAMNGLQREEDPSSLSSPNYDPLIHLNQIFPDPSSLNSIAAVQLHLTQHLKHLDAEIKSASQERNEQQSTTQERINELQKELEDLFNSVEAVKAKAEKADGVMGSLTGGIRRLDGGKQNLTTSMTALKRLQMLSILPLRSSSNSSYGIRTASHTQQVSPI